MAYDATIPPPGNRMNYICPRCKQSSIPSALGDNCCTACSNHLLHGHADPKLNGVKPIVEYDTDESCFIVLGYGASVKPINHPSNLVSNKRMVHTSRVIAVTVNEDHSISFETENTRYVPKGKSWNN
jgi:DNA-directed RNA polymerase subunit RPC12/RpoP